MDLLIRQITDHLVSGLPENENFYRIQNLEDYGFPSFLIRRIYIELQWNLDESMVLPNTDWANTQSEAVQQSWQRFLKAIHAEVQLPASYARAVIETAVADVVEILVQPRKRIPEILFGGEEALTANQLEERAELLVVYPHFARVLKAYMQRKNQGELNRKRCEKILRQVDEKITAQYTPLQWAQMLDPLFVLGGNAVDTNIFRLFFEDKNKPHIARAFDLKNDTITRAKFIEVLSSPDMLNYKGYESSQPEFFNDDTEPEVSDGDDIAEAQKNWDPSALQENTAPAEIRQEAPTQEREVDKHGAENNSDEIPEPAAINRPAMEESDEAELEKQQVDEEERISSTSSLNDFFGDAKDQPEKVTSEDIEIEESDRAEEKSPREAEAAIWQRFLVSDELEQEDAEEEAYIDEPVIDLTVDKDEVNQEKEKLEQLLENERSYYVEELFGGSDHAYETSLYEIAQKDDWKSASKEIETNIFKRNMINIYSEPAVDFTDRLQTYFLDKKNNK